MPFKPGERAVAARPSSEFRRAVFGIAAAILSRGPKRECAPVPRTPGGAAAHNFGFSLKRAKSFWRLAKSGVAIVTEEEK